MYRILYRFLASLARLAVRSGRSKDLEIIVLRHQLAVLRRQIDRPELTDSDRSLLGAIAAALARPSRTGWLVTPDTLLRWHRRRIVGHWTQPQRPPGRHLRLGRSASEFTPEEQVAQPGVFDQPSQRGPAEVAGVPGVGLRAHIGQNIDAATSKQPKEVVALLVGVAGCPQLHLSGHSSHTMPGPATVIFRGRSSSRQCPGTARSAPNGCTGTRRDADELSRSRPCCRQWRTPGTVPGTT